jgi:hypothetical protein
MCNKYFPSGVVVNLVYHYFFGGVVINPADFPSAMVTNLAHRACYVQYFSCGALFMWWEDYVKIYLAVCSPDLVD